MITHLQLPDPVYVLMTICMCVQGAKYKDIITMVRPPDTDIRLTHGNTSVTL